MKFLFFKVSSRKLKKFITQAFSIIMIIGLLLTAMLPVLSFLK